jgi:hypothetical protein
MSLQARQWGILALAILFAGPPTGSEASQHQLETTRSTSPHLVLADAGLPPGVRMVRVDINAINAAIDYDAKAGPRAIAVVQQFLDNRVPIIPLPPEDIHDRFDPGLNVVYWNSTAALQVADDSGAGTGKYLSPALLLLDAINDSVAWSKSHIGYQNLLSSPVPLYESRQRQYVISGLVAADARPTLHLQTQDALAGADLILNDANGNGLENAAAATLGEPVRKNGLLVLKDNKIVEGVTFVTVTDPTWHHN